MELSEGGLDEVDLLFLLHLALVVVLLDYLFVEVEIADVADPW